MTDRPPEPAPRDLETGLSRGLTLVLAAAAGLIVANLYYVQPLLDLVRASFGATQREVGFIATLTQLGYGAGMLLLVPLGDRYERRRLIVGMTFAVALALVAVTLAPTLPLLGLASFALGLTTMVPQLIVPFAAGLARPRARGRVVGTVMSGLLVGILLSRTLSGIVGAHLGWRAMYVIAAGLMLVVAVLLRLLLPRQEAEAKVPFGVLFRSLLTLVRDEPVLRRHAILGALTFAAFSVFWTTLAFHLATPPHHYGSEVVGAFGVVGVVGALAAPLVGRYSDAYPPRVVNGAAVAIVLVAFFVFYAAGGSLVGLGVGVVLLDLGAQSNHISNQTRIFGLDPPRRNRLNTVYMTSYFGGGALGSWLGAEAWSGAGWAGVTALGAALSIAALVVLYASPASPGAGDAGGSPRD